MGDGKFLIGKPSGGVTTVTMTDGASNTNLALPESGTVATLSNIQGFKNLIINGRKQVNQSGLTVTDNAYNYDNHYKAGNNWFQFIDGKNIISGDSYTISWDGVATAGYYIGIAGATTINAQTFTAIANGETITPTITSSQILWIKFASDSTGSTYNKVQFEPGSVPTPYEQRLYELEELLVQKLYRLLDLHKTDYYVVASSYNIKHSYNFTQMRRVPSFIFVNLTNLNPSIATINVGASSISGNALSVVYATAGSTGAFSCSGTAILDARP